MKRLICFFKGHKVTNVDCGYQYCDRCNGHEYYDDNFALTIRSPLHFLKSKKNLMYTRCDDCGKISSMWIIPIGDHSNCLPF